MNLFAQTGEAACSAEADTRVKFPAEADGGIKNLKDCPTQAENSASHYGLLENVRRSQISASSKAERQREYGNRKKERGLLGPWGEPRTQKRGFDSLIVV